MCATASSSTPRHCGRLDGVSSPASGHPAAASLAATRWTFSGPASWWVTSLMNASISSVSISPSASGGRAFGGEVAHHLFDLILGQRGGAQQCQQRNAIGPRHTFGVAGAQPVQDGAQKEVVVTCPVWSSGSRGATTARTVRLRAAPRSPKGILKLRSCWESCYEQISPVVGWSRPCHAHFGLQRRGPVMQSVPSQEARDDH